eukprot:6172064-Pleurochrysis_carterae.AAC.3
MRFFEQVASHAGRSAQKAHARLAGASRSLPKSLVPALAALLISSYSSMLVPELALAEAGDEKTIAEIPASGMIFKDTIKLQRFSDPKVKGVVLYVSDFQRPITERLAKDFFSDPTQARWTWPGRARAQLYATRGFAWHGGTVSSKEGGSKQTRRITPWTLSHRR